MKFELKKNFDFNKIKINQLSSAWMNILASHINKTIQENLDKGIDLDNKPFAQVSEFTRNSVQDGKPHKKTLVRSGRMRTTKILRAARNKLRFKITSGSMKSKSRWNVEYKGKKSSGSRNKSGYNYGTFHQPATGATFQLVNYTSKDSLIPNKKVPLRKWFGIPKNMLPTGPDWKKFALQYNLTFQRFLTTAMKKFKV